MTTTRLPKTITAGALLATPIPPVKWIIPGLLPAGLAIFAGPSKAGKSWLTLWLCLQISQGKSVWGREIEPRTVLYFSLEDTLGRLQERLYQLVDAEEDPERLILQTESHGIGQGLEEQIVSFIHTYPDISLIVIDTLQKVRKADRNGSMYANDYKDIGALKELADKYGICILLVHHLRKQSSSDPYDQISGSTGIMGVADTTWLMHRQRMSKTATIRVIGRDMDEKMLHIREENCVWTLDEEETAEQQALKAIPDYLWKVADYIDSVGKWQGTATELLVAANISDVKPAFSQSDTDRGKEFVRPCRTEQGVYRNGKCRDRSKRRDGEIYFLAEKRTAERCIAPPQPNCSGAMATPQKGNQGTSVKSDPVPKNGRPLAGASRTMRVRQVARTTQSETIIARRARAAAQRKAQWAMLRDATKDNGNTAKKLSRTAVQAVKTVGKGVASAGNSILTAGGGAAVLVLLLMVVLVAAIVASPFGILFSNESREAGVVPLSAAVAQANYEFNERLETLQTADDYDSISVDGQAADWIEVLAVFAVKVAGADVDATDVATMDADRIARLKAVFWDMTTITHRVEIIHHPGSGDDDGWTERNLYITITAKTAEEMKTEYHFNRNQIAALDELLEQRDLLRELIEDVYSVSGDTAALLRNLPEDLSPEREAVVRSACSLVGKVNYFWGGKSLVLGWDSRWGELRQVTAAGSSTTGTYRPYGLDCSGFVDWVFYNQSGGSYVIGHGGGATMQHSYCTDISWSDAQPGDLVFYPDNSHVGIVGGVDEDGNILIVHCASGHNNVVITGKEGFTSIGRPRYYTI